MMGFFYDIDYNRKGFLASLSKIFDKRKVNNLENKYAIINYEIIANFIQYLYFRISKDGYDLHKENLNKLNQMLDKLSRECVDICKVYKKEELFKVIPPILTLGATNVSVSNVPPAETAEYTLNYNYVFNHINDPVTITAVPIVGTGRPDVAITHDSVNKTITFSNLKDTTGFSNYQFLIKLETGKTGYVVTEILEISCLISIPGGGGGGS